MTFVTIALFVLIFNVSNPHFPSLPENYYESYINYYSIFIWFTFSFVCFYIFTTLIIFSFILLDQHFDFKELNRLGDRVINFNSNIPNNNDP